MATENLPKRHEVEVCDECGETTSESVHATSAHQNGPTHWEWMVPEAEAERYRKALQEARPYVLNRTQDEDWRAETARDVLSRVDAALAIPPLAEGDK